jgi:hypothetical protein
VLVAGEPRGASPCDVRLPDGKGLVDIEVRAPGYRIERRILDLSAPPSTLRLPLRPLRAPPPSLPPSRAAAPPPARGRHASPGAGGTVDPFAP